MLLSGGPSRPPLGTLLHQAQARVNDLGPRRASPAPRGLDAPPGLPLNQLLDRVERLEQCFGDQLQAVFDACRGLLADEAGEQRRHANDTEQTWECLKQLEACVREHEGKLLQCAPAAELALCVREGDWVALQERLDERFRSHIERLSEHRADVQKTVKALREKVNQRCVALERHTSEQQAQQAVLVQKLETQEQRYMERDAWIEHQLQDQASALQAIADAAQRREAELLQQLGEQKRHGAELAQQVEEHTKANEVSQLLETSSREIQEEAYRMHHSHAEALEARVQSHGSDLKRGMEAWVQSHGSALKKDVLELLDTSSQRLKEQTDQAQQSQVASLEARMQSQCAQLKSDVAEMLKGFDSVSKRDQTDALHEQATHAEKIELQLHSHGAQVKSEVAQLVETSSRKIQESAAQQHQSQADSFKLQMQSHGARIQAEIMKEVSELIARSSQQLKLETELSSQQVKQEAIRVKQGAESQTHELDARLSNVTETMRVRMDQSKKELEDARARLDAMSRDLALTSSKKEMEDKVEQLTAASSPFEQRLQRALEEARAAGEDGRVAAARAAEEATAAARGAAQHFKDLEERGDAISEGCRRHSERLVSELRAEASTALDAAKRPLEVTIEELKRGTASMKKDFSNAVREVQESEGSLSKQLERVTEEARNATEGGRTAARLAEEASAAAQSAESRVRHQEQRLNDVAETSHQQLERLTSEIRTEARSHTDALENKLGITIKELQVGSTALKNQLERTADELRDTSASFVKQVQQASDEARAVGERCATATQGIQELGTGVQRCETRLHSLDSRLSVAVEACRQQVERQASELRAEAASSTEVGRRQLEQLAEELRSMAGSLSKQVERAASELRTEAVINSETLKKHAERLVDEVRDSTANFARQLQRTNEEASELTERSMNIARAAEEARTAAQRSEGRVGSLEGRIDAVVDARCLQVERTCKEVSLQARSHGDTVFKQHSHAMEELRSTSGLLAKQVQQAMEEARAAGDRGAAATQVAQEAVATAQRAEGSTSRLNVTSTSAAMEVSRNQLDRVASDIRMEARNGIDNLGRELESTVLELRGTISSLALQVECGVSGSSSVLADAVGTAAQRHVENLEWLKALDGHRGQMEKTQSELEERLSSLLRAQEVSLRADIDGVKLHVSEQRSRMADLDTGFTKTRCSLESLAANLSRMDTQFRARMLEFTSFSESTNERINALQSGISANQWGVVTIAGAISTIAKPNEASA